MIAAGELGRFLRLANLTGQPTLSLPCGTTGDGMPVGLQIIGHWLAEANLLALAGAYQEKTDWHQRRPPVFVNNCLGRAR